MMPYWEVGVIASKVVDEKDGCCLINRCACVLPSEFMAAIRISRRRVHLPSASRKSDDVELAKVQRSAWEVCI